MIDKENLKYPWMSQFTINACRRHGGCLGDSARRALVQGGDFEREISMAFTWRNTPQGHDYWGDIEVSYND